MKPPLAFLRWNGETISTSIPRRWAAYLLRAARSRRASNVVRTRAGWWVRDSGATIQTRPPAVTITPSRRRLAALFRNPAASPVGVGLTWFAPVSIDGRQALQARNWHGASSVIASDYPHATDAAELIRAIWADRRHYRKPFPLADHYKRG